MLESKNVNVNNETEKYVDACELCGYCCELCFYTESCGHYQDWDNISDIPQVKVS